MLPDLTVLGKILAGGMPGGAVAGRAGVMDHLGGIRRRPAAGRRTPARTTRTRSSAAAGVATLAWCPRARRSSRPHARAAALRAELSAIFERCGVPGRAYGESSTFHLLFGPEPAGRARPGRR